MTSCKLRGIQLSNGTTRYGLYVNGKERSVHSTIKSALEESGKIMDEEAKKLPMISADEFCRFFGLTYSEDAESKDGLRSYYDYIAENSAEETDVYYGSKPAELASSLEDLFDDYVDIPLESYGFSYTTSEDLMMPGYYEQAQGWIETSRRDLIDSELYRVVCAIATCGRTITA